MTKIFPWKILSKSRKGFTLIEVLIVLAILAAIAMFGIPKIYNKEKDIKAIARQLTTLSREVRQHARLSHSTYRIAFHMEDKKCSYWVESSTSAKPIDPEEIERTFKGEKKSDDDTSAPAFQIDKSIIKNEKKLAENIKILLVDSVNFKQPQTSGNAYVHFTSEGFVEAAVVQISFGERNIWSLIFNPLTGHADIVDKAITLKEAQQ